MKMDLLPLFLVAGTVSLAPEASAQNFTGPTAVRVYQNDWAFTPVVQITDGVVDVLGALALRDTANATGENLVAVWYTNPHAANTAWPSQAWDSTSQWDAIKWVKTTYGISDTWDFVWPASEADPNSPNVVDPSNYVAGLLEGDPFAELGGSITHDDLVQILVDAGYKAASIPVDKEGPCDTKTVLPALEDLTVAHVLYRPSEQELRDTFATTVTESCGGAGLEAWANLSCPETATASDGTNCGRLTGSYLSCTGVSYCVGWPWRRYEQGCQLICEYELGCDGFQSAYETHDVFDPFCGASGGEREYPFRRKCWGTLSWRCQASGN